MEVELGPLPKYENVRYNAYWSKVHIDTRLKPDSEDIDCYKEHLKDCDRHPTSGFLARRKYITKKNYNYPGCAHRNLNFLNNQPEIQKLKENIESTVNQLYPKTKQARKYIIDNDRVLLDYVTKGKRYNLKDKLIILLKRFI